MPNLFRITPDKSLDREYLTTCAIYRCIRRYGMTKEEAIKQLIKRWPPKPNKKYAAERIVSIWTH